MGSVPAAESAQTALTAEERRFGRYELLFRLASGGMAQLYVGRLRGVEGFEKLVVIKLIHDEYAEESSFVKMFIDEARLLGRISHPNVVQVMELGEVDGAYYIAMEYVHGESLGAFANRVHIPLLHSARIISDAAAGLHAAHELRDLDGAPLSVVHRDVSPGNILISYGGAVKVTDFGVARALGNLSVTHVGTLKGKFSYMAPEYLRSGTVDRRSDIFALGVVLYEISTRKRLFKTSIDGRRLEHGGDEILPPTLLRADYPPALEQIVMRALEDDPSMRFQTAQEMHNALEQYIISSGAPALNSDLGELMTETFAERMAKKRTLISESSRHSVALPEIANEPSPASTLKGQTISQAGQITKSRKVLLLATGVLLALAVVVLVVYALLPPPMAESPAGPVAAAAVDLAISPVEPDGGAADLARPDLALPDLPPLDLAPEPDRPRQVRPRRPSLPAKVSKQPAKVSKQPAKVSKQPAKPRPVPRPAAKKDDLFGNPFQ
jgi:serine/threonine protein kinase